MSELLPIEVIAKDTNRGILNTSVYQYPAVGTSIAFPEDGKFVKYEVVDTIQMVSTAENVPPRVLVIVRFERALNI